MSSPTLINQLATFLLTGGAIRFEDLGSGAAGTFQAAAGDQGAVIRLDDSILASLNGGDSYRLESFLGAVAHELGHAMTSIEGFQLDASNRDAYIESGLMNEAYAVLNAMLVMHEVTVAGNVDVIPMMVFTGGNAGQAYESLYAQFGLDADLTALLNGITDHLRELPGNPYGELYGNDWDSRFD